MFTNSRFSFVIFFFLLPYFDYIVRVLSYKRGRERGKKKKKMNARAEAKELRSLVAVMEREREEMEIQLEDYDDELVAERERIILLEDKLSRHRSEERESPIAINTAAERQLEESEIVIHDLENQLTEIHESYSEKLHTSSDVISNLKSEIASLTVLLGDAKNSNQIFNEQQLVKVMQDKDLQHQRQLSDLSETSRQHIEALTEQVNSLQVAQRRQTTEVDHQKFLKIMEEKELLHQQKVSQLASKIATLEIQNNKLSQEVSEDKDDKMKEMEVRLQSFEAEREILDCDLLTLRTELAELRMCRELSMDETTDAIQPIREPDHNIIATSDLFDLGEEEVISLGEQYESRIRHFTSLKKDVDRELHSRKPHQYNDPDKDPADTSLVMNEDLESEGVLDSEWLDLVSWMSSRFGSRTSLKELRSYIKSFAPRKLRAPLQSTSPDVSQNSFPKWRGSSPSESSIFTTASERSAFDKLFNEGRIRGRALYQSDHIGEELDATLSPQRQ